ncbi:MAG: hypothetical protein CMF78_02595 [Candidatus Marinimicrobia bacterium]|nr:hypothetical protein [Candidatus Neomarinimicrobiota bacterium]
MVKHFKNIAKGKLYMSNEFKSVEYEDIIYKYGADWTSYLESYEHGGGVLVSAKNYGRLCRVE